MKLEDLQANKVYRHIKTGNLYVVSGLGEHTETNEKLVVYYRVDVGFAALPWVRPQSLFLEKFEAYA